MSLTPEQIDAFTIAIEQELEDEGYLGSTWTNLVHAPLEGMDPDRRQQELMNMVVDIAHLFFDAVNDGSKQREQKERERIRREEEERRERERRAPVNSRSFYLFGCTCSLCADRADTIQSYDPSTSNYTDGIVFNSNWIRYPRLNPEPEVVGDPVLGTQDTLTPLWTVDESDQERIRRIVNDPLLTEDQWPDMQNVPDPQHDDKGL